MTTSERRLIHVPSFFLGAVFGASVVLCSLAVKKCPPEPVPVSHPTDHSPPVSGQH